MSSKEGSGGFRKRKHDNFPHNQRREGKDVNSSSPVMLAFKSFQQELDARHDKYERLVKLSRDITVESKRTIFLLHRITSAPYMDEILTEAEIKLDGVRQKILQVAQELSGEDMHQFHRAITTGLQEYVEAVSFQHFIKTRSLISMDEINKQLIFSTEDNGKENKTASHCCGISRCGAQAPDAQAQRPWLRGPAAPRHVGSSRTRARTRVPCIGRRTLNHCTTREVLCTCILDGISKHTKSGICLKIQWRGREGRREEWVDN
ncbi:translin-associated protein X isoform X4 [Tursiops truncatus]|uniref:translin-associated protein X isoform X4 n=1 Tax=Tursiops truncatus TaxID=9739 RepID=UPI003CCF46ED